MLGDKAQFLNAEGAEVKNAEEMGEVSSQLCESFVDSAFRSLKELEDLTS